MKKTCNFSFMFAIGLVMAGCSAESEGIKQKDHTEYFRCEGFTVIDGDTVSCEGKGTFNIAGIDAPELNQPYGFTSKTKLNWHSRTPYIKCKYIDETKEYAVCLESMRDPESWHFRGWHDIASIYVSFGHAWNNPDQAPDYSEEENYAKDQVIGLWDYGDIIIPMEPWVWRKRHGIDKKD